MNETAANRRTALYGEHVALGARMVPFAGFDMPVQYSSHPAPSTTPSGSAPGSSTSRTWPSSNSEGDDVAAWADAMTVNNVATMKPLAGALQYLHQRSAAAAHDDVLFSPSPATAGKMAARGERLKRGQDLESASPERKARRHPTDRTNPRRPRVDRGAGAGCARHRCARSSRPTRTASDCVR